MTDLSAYELQRLENIRRNEMTLAALGLGSGGSAMINTKPKEKKKPTGKKPAALMARTQPLNPTRGSRRLAGEEVELQGIEMQEPIYDSDGSDLAPGEVMEKTTIKYGRKRHGNARLTAEQAAKLDGLEPGLVKELTPEQVEALPRVLEDLATNRGGGWSGFSSYRMQARKVLQESAKQHGLPWPSWLTTIESRMNELQKKAGLKPIGTENLNQVMWALECAASGLGIGYRHWPVDVEMLKLEGEKLELAFGNDTSNGWCYRHALGKLAYLQDAMLEEHFGETKAAPSIFELEVERKEEGGDEEGEAEDDEQATKRPRVA